MVNAEVLLLNRNFRALQLTSWQRAITLVYRDLALIVDEEYKTYDFATWLELSRTIRESPAGFISTPSLRLAVPEVIALRFFEKLPCRNVPFTRRNIYQHYQFRCCYCGRGFPSDELNLEHVVPRSRGGRTDWFNVVTACIPCNLRKGNRLPEEAGMRLIQKPSRPGSKNAFALLLRAPIPLRRSWQRFIDNVYWNVQLED